MDVRCPPTFGMIRSVGSYFIFPVTPLWEEDWSQGFSADVDSADVYSLCFPFFIRAIADSLISLQV